MPRSAKQFKRDDLWLSVLDALEAHAALLDAEGGIVAVNRAWTEFAKANGAKLVNDGVGTNYLHVCDEAVGRPGSEGATEVAAGLRALVANRAAEFVQIYPCHSPDQKRWFRLRAKRLGHDGACVLMLHTRESERECARRILRERFRALSEREFEVLEHVVGGLSSRRIADALGISRNTVENHRRLILTKTRAENTADLVRMAIVGDVVEIGRTDTESGAG